MAVVKQPDPNPDDAPVTMGVLTKMLAELVKDDKAPPGAPEPPAQLPRRQHEPPAGSLTDQIELALRRREEQRQIARGAMGAPPPPKEDAKSWRERLFG